MTKPYAFIRRLATSLIMLTAVFISATHSHADSQYKTELNNLFGALADAQSVDDANTIITNIWQIWRTDTEDSVNIQMMRRGIGFMEQGDYINAEAIFTRIINRDNDFMEAWNKRATIRYMMGNLNGSEQDIAEVLKREPRHFGALSGLGMINIQRGDLKSALKIYQNILTIHPLNTDANQLIPELKLKLRGDPA